MSLRQVEVGLPAHPLQDPQQVGVVRGEQGATPQQQEADKPGLQLAEPDGEAERQRQDQDAELALDAEEPRPFHQRSEEHTSELQSLMRISYAVFCLKKKNKKQERAKQDSNQDNTLSKKIQHVYNNSIR